MIAAPALAKTVKAPLDITIDLSSQAGTHAFRPDEALGAGIDGAQQGQIDQLLTPGNIAAMRSLGLRPLTYRLRTELGIQAWHWSERGAWSNPAKAEGYWTSEAGPQPPINLSWGYNLPRRGDTTDNANDTGYSRLTDGDPKTFWKSNPYLDPTFTHEAEPRPQWFIVSLAKAGPIDAMRIAWGEPFARTYSVQYWSSDDDYDPNGRWITFPWGAFENGHGGSETLRLSPSAINAHYVRVLMSASSGTAPADSTDARDGLGYAVREVSVGHIDQNGAFSDSVIHAASRKGQTPTHVSSTDPWHRAVDRDPNLEQVGVDRIFANGLGNSLPIMMPVGILYDTPDNAAALIQYLKVRGHPVHQVELGEEPDGQYGDPADYGALYLEFFDRLKRLDPDIAYGGPSLQSAATDLPLVDAKARSWNQGFIAYLKSRKRLEALQFFSFEHYPFDNTCGRLDEKLIKETALLDAMLLRLRREGVPPSIPWIISEYGFSAYSGQALVEPQAALLQADIVGHFLSAGGRAAYMFGYGPEALFAENLACTGYGAMAPFLAGSHGEAGETLPSFHMSRLLSQEWLAPGHGLHRVYDARIVVSRPTKQTRPGTVVAYAVRRPDGKVGALIINRSATQTFMARLQVKTPPLEKLSGRSDIYQYGAEQYKWRPDGSNGRPSRNLPPAHWRASSAMPVRLPANSVTVVTAPLEAAPQKGASLSGRR